MYVCMYVCMHVSMGRRSAGDIKLDSLREGSHGREAESGALLSVEGLANLHVGERLGRLRRGIDNPGGGGDCLSDLQRCDATVRTRL